jgi:hypothetical protein
MKKADGKRGMLREYDFTNGVRGKYVERLSHGSNLVLLEPDVAAAFPTSAAVNKALRKQIKPPRPRKTG